jgi:hypothetical protein
MSEIMARVELPLVAGSLDHRGEGLLVDLD